MRSGKKKASSGIVSPFPDIQPGQKHLHKHRKAGAGLSLALPCLAHQKCWAVGIALVMLVLLPLQLPLPQPYCRCTWSWQGHGRLGQSDLLSQALMAGQLSSCLVSPSFPGTTCTVGVVFVCSTGATGRKMVPPETEITL